MSPHNQHTMSSTCVPSRTSTSVGHNRKLSVFKNSKNPTLNETLDMHYNNSGNNNNHFEDL